MAPLDVELVEDSVIVVTGVRTKRIWLNDGLSVERPDFFGFQKGPLCHLGQYDRYLIKVADSAVAWSDSAKVAIAQSRNVNSYLTATAEKRKLVLALLQQKN